MCARSVQHPPPPPAPLYETDSWVEVSSTISSQYLSTSHTSSDSFTTRDVTFHVPVVCQALHSWSLPGTHCTQPYGTSCEWWAYRWTNTGELQKSVIKVAGHHLYTVCDLLYFLILGWPGSTRHITKNNKVKWLIYYALLSLNFFLPPL